MSATPIPRTLSLILYGDLDVSVLDEMPPGRMKVDTFLVVGSYRARIEAFIRKQLDAGRQAFIVCPLVEENGESDDKKAVTEYAERIRPTFAPYAVGCVHGRQKPAEKDRVRPRSPPASCTSSSRPPSSRSAWTSPTPR